MLSKIRYSPIKIFLKMLMNKFTIIRLGLVLIFSSILSVGNSQNSSMLDQKFGINKFKLESNIENYINDLDYKSTDNNVKYYTYRNVSKIKILDENLNEIWLGFYKNKLYIVSVYLKNTDNNIQMEVLKKLENLFGPSIKGWDDNQDWAYKWETKKTYLGYSKSSCMSKFMPCIAHIYMFSNKIKFQIENDSF